MTSEPDTPRPEERRRSVRLSLPVRLAPPTALGTGSPPIRAAWPPLAEPRPPVETLPTAKEAAAAQAEASPTTVRVHPEAASPAAPSTPAEDVPEAEQSFTPGTLRGLVSSLISPMATPRRQRAYSLPGYRRLRRVRESTPLSDVSESSSDGAEPYYLQTPDPHDLRDFTNDWDQVPQPSKLLWRPPSRDGVRRSERLRRTYYPLHQERRALRAVYRLLTSTVVLLASVLLALCFGWRAGVVGGVLPAPMPLPLPAARLPTPLACLLDPTCAAWSHSRTRTVHTLLARTHSHVLATAAFRNSTNTLLPALAASHQDLAPTMADVHVHVAACTRLLKRFGGYLLQQSGRAVVPPPPPPPAWEATLRRNYAGLVSALRWHAGVVDGVLLDAQGAVRHAVGSVLDLDEDDAEVRKVVGRARALAVGVKRFRDGAVRAWVAALVGGGSEEGAAGSLAAAFERFHAALDALEGGGAADTGRGWESGPAWAEEPEEPQQPAVSEDGIGEDAPDADKAWMFEQAML